MKSFSVWWMQTDGQASVEYALIICAFLALLVGIAALWRAAEMGLLVELAIDASSHQLNVKGLEDAALY